VRRGVDEPGGVQAEHGAEEDSPEEIGPSTEAEEKETENGDGQPVPLADPDVEFVFAEFRDVGEEIVGVIMHGGASDEPADMGPEPAVVGRVRIAFLVGVLMMLAVDGDPEDGSAFEGERSADSEEILHPFGRLVATMGEEAMVAHAYAEASGDPPEKHCDEEGLPVEHEERGDGAEVERNHDEEREPDDGLRKGTIVSERSRRSHMSIGLPSVGTVGNSCVRSWDWWFVR